MPIVEQVKPIIGLKSLSQNWTELSRDYRPSAFWFWNGPMDSQSIHQTVESLVKNDIREFVIHPIHGMEVEYLSEDYFEYMELALRLARENDLKVWIYDEYGWPSGNVGGKLLEKYPEYRGWFLGFYHGNDGSIQVTPTRSDMLMDNAMGAPWTNNSKGQLDSLSPKAVACFIDMTYQENYDKFSDYFGNTIVGFFTDEPAAMIPHALDLNDNFWNAPALPWTPELPGLFLEKYKYEIEPQYSRLAESGFSQVKEDYRQLVKELHCDVYHGQIGRWCRKHGVKYSGHIGEDTLLQQVRFSGSAFGSLSLMDEPGIDQLFYSPVPDDRFIQQIVVSSIARHSDKPRTFCEAWGISPLDLRLSTMFHQAEMLGIHGINDIALMGFHQNLDGVRKYTYWPPMFETSPWWQWYGEFKESFARAVALSSLGKRTVKYAILYPQYQLEQESVFTKLSDADNLAGKLIHELGSTVYEAGETFEFVFPEIMDQATVRDGKIVFPYATYDAILAPSDLTYFEASHSVLEYLKKNGACVLNDRFGSIRAEILDAQPSWKNQIEIESDGDSGMLRIYPFEYPDGEIYALRNVSNKPLSVAACTGKAFSEWNPLEGTCKKLTGRIEKNVEAYTTTWLSVSDESVSNDIQNLVELSESLETKWTIADDTCNLMSLNDIQFKMNEDWIGAVKFTLPGSTQSCRKITLPENFRKQTNIEFRGFFNSQAISTNLGLVYEPAHLDFLEINGQMVDLDTSRSFPIWDKSCRWIDIASLVKKGENQVAGILKFKLFETSIESDAFYGFWHPMPSCDIFLAGNFYNVDGQITSSDSEAFKLPLDLSKEGWGQVYGTIKLETDIELSEVQAERISAIEVMPFSKDAIEVLWDGHSLGKGITEPYRFNLPVQKNGYHKFQIKLAGTAANLFCDNIDWGIDGVSLIYKNS
ncbi:MAG: hypothetical protein KAH17_00735 [Bacteroidales bacterium]|nr:hypothetical protein [Bacteroidales bacterium]